MVIFGRCMMGEAYATGSVYGGRTSGIIWEVLEGGRLIRNGPTEKKLIVSEGI
jgi:hypothetical protein